MKSENILQVIHNTTDTAQATLGISQEAAFDIAIATMIHLDADAMRNFLTAAHEEYRKQAA